MSETEKLFREAMSLIRKELPLQFSEIDWNAEPIESYYKKKKMLDNGYSKEHGFGAFILVDEIVAEEGFYHLHISHGDVAFLSGYQSSDVFTFSLSESGKLKYIGKRNIGYLMH